ncbi:hypothetical protein ES705_05549 [subsurface metagenome]
MGYGGGGGAASFLDLTDTPETYAGQALKLAKVNAGETGLDLGLLLSFTDWYAGGAPASHPWEFEAPRPYASADIYFSPIVKNGIGQFIVYIALGYDTQYFYRYNITTKQWHRLADSPAPLYHSALSLSPDGSKLVGVGVNDKYLYIYDIEGNSWTTSPAAPQIDAGDIDGIVATVWTDDDTIWCQVRKVPKVKCFKYTVSTSTWSDFPNDISPNQNDGFAMAVNSAGTILYVSNIGAAQENFLKYTIATDNYNVGGTFGGSWEPIRCGDRGARLWILVAAGDQHQYWNCDTDVKILAGFAANPQETVRGHYGVIYDGDRSIIGWVRTGDEPTNMSYFGTGTWKLAQRVLTDYNLVVFKKPTDGFPILAIDKVNGFTIPIYRFTTLALPAGTWEFFYPKEGDYTQLKISGSELK